MTNIDSEEWLANNLIGLIDAEKQLLLTGKRDAIDWAAIRSFLNKHRPERKPVIVTDGSGRIKSLNGIPV